MLQQYQYSDYMRGNIRTTEAIRYTRFIHGQCELLAKRHRASEGYPNRIIDAIDQMLGIVDMGIMDHYDNDYDRYTRYVMEIEQTLIGVFGPNTYTKVWNGELTDNRYIVESVVPIRRADYFKQLPFDKSFEHWDDVYPLRVMAHDSSEFTLNVNDDKISFRYDVPTFVLFGIDVVALVFKYYHFRKQDTLTSRNVFLHRHVTVGFMFDLLDIWMRNRVADLVMGTGTRCLKADNYPYDSTYNYIGQRYQSLVSSVVYLKTLLENGNIGPKDYLASLPMPEGFYSQWINKRLDEMVLRTERQYLWISALRDIQDIGILANAHTDNNDRASSSRFKNYLKRRLDIYDQNKIWSYPHPVIGRALERVFTNVYNDITE